MKAALCALEKRACVVKKKAKQNKAKYTEILT